ncbi:hypothetical protein, partial [Kingella kingae]
MNFEDVYLRNSRAGIDNYSERCLKRGWVAERFSWYSELNLEPVFTNNYLINFNICEIYPSLTKFSA